MEGSIIKLVIQSILAGSGFAKADEQTQLLMKRMGKMGQAAQILGRSFGDLGGTIGSAIGMLAHGGIWGAAAHVATMAIDKCISLCREFKQTAEDARLAARGMSREFMTLEAMASGYRKRVESYRKANEEAERAERAANDERKKQIAAMNEQERRDTELVKAFASAQASIQQETLKAAMMSDRENESLRAKVKLILAVADANVKAKERNVYDAKKSGDVQQTSIANMELDVARAQQKTARAEAHKLVDDYKRKKAEEKAAKEAEEEAAEKEMMELQRREFVEQENRKKREQAAKAEGEIRKMYLEAIKKIEAEIVAKKREAEELEQNAQRARGVSFGDWERGERDRERETRKAERQQKNREASVDREIDRLEKTNPKAMTEWQRNRLARLREWKADQNPENNPAIKAVKELEAKREKLITDQTKKLDEIKTLLEKVTTL